MSFLLSGMLGIAMAIVVYVCYPYRISQEMPRKVMYEFLLVSGVLGMVMYWAAGSHSVVTMLGMLGVILLICKVTIGVYASKKIELSGLIGVVFGMMLPALIIVAGISLVKFVQSTYEVTHVASVMIAISPLALGILAYFVIGLVVRHTGKPQEIN